MGPVPIRERAVTVVDSAVRYLALPPAGVGRPVLIIHSWWGLTSSFTTFADELAADGYLAGCADLYHGAVATSEKEARALRSVKRTEPAYRTLRRCLVELSADPRSTGTDPAVIGFSMGGHWAAWLAQHPPPPVSATVLYYATRGGDFTDATAPVLAHFADDDPFVSASARRRMARAVSEQGLSYTAYDYPGTGHWFAESGHRAHDPDAARVARRRTLDFLSGAV